MIAAAGRHATAGYWIAAAACFGLLQFGLLDNPGYFSHDELQWAARADVDSIAELPWEEWRAVETFQYRPLTFNLWLLVSHALFDLPRLYHALWLALGFANAALLYASLRGLQVQQRHAAAGAAAFAFSPYAVYVHGWTATLAELLWVAAALSGLALLLRLSNQHRWQAALIGLICTGLALLSKEAGLAVTPLLLLGWLVSNRDARWLHATLGSAVPTLAYLVLRLPTLLFAPRPQGAYEWSLLAPPLRWAEMQLYPFFTTALEFSSIANASAPRIMLATALAVVLGLAVWLSRPRVAVIHLVGGAMAMGPALVLQTGYPQYGYGFAALSCGCIAYAWPTMSRALRVGVALALLVASWHGFNVQRELYRIGHLQATFSPALSDALRSQSGPAPLRLTPEVAADAGLYRRLTQPIERYHGVAINVPIEIVEPTRAHAGRITARGTIELVSDVRD